jgi:hypothetical protein
MVGKISTICVACPLYSAPCRVNLVTKEKIPLIQASPQEQKDPVCSGRVEKRDGRMQGKGEGRRGGLEII